MKLRKIYLCVALSLVWNSPTYSLAPSSNYPEPSVGFELQPVGAAMGAEDWNDSLGTPGVYASQFERYSKKRVAQLLKEKKFMRLVWTGKRWRVSRPKQGRLSDDLAKQAEKKLRELNRWFSDRKQVNEWFSEEIRNSKTLFNWEKIQIILIDTGSRVLAAQGDAVQVARAGTNGGKGLFIYIPIEQFLGVSTLTWASMILREELNHAAQKYLAQKGKLAPVLESFTPDHRKKLFELAGCLRSPELSEWVRCEREEEKGVPLKAIRMSCPYSEILAQGEQNQKALLALVQKMAEQMRKGKSAASARKNAQAEFEALGPIPLRVHKNGEGHLFSMLQHGSSFGFFGKIRWTEVARRKIFQDEISEGTEVLLLPGDDLSFTVAVFQQGTEWKCLRGVKLMVPDEREFRRRFVSSRRSRTKYLVWSKNLRILFPFEEHADLTFPEEPRPESAHDTQPAWVEEPLASIEKNTGQRKSDLLILVQDVVRALKKDGRRSLPRLKEEFQNRFLEIGPLVLPIEANGRGQFISYFYGSQRVDGLVYKGKLRWAPLAAKHSDLIRAGRKAVLLPYPQRPLTYSVAVIGADGKWNPIDDFLVQVTDELKGRFVAPAGKNATRKYMELKKTDVRLQISAAEISL